jgi:hypothetical protein
LQASAREKPSQVSAATGLKVTTAGSLDGQFESLDIQLLQDVLPTDGLQLRA